MVAGMAVGGEAIDLSCATHAVFAELDWTPLVVYQARMRTFSPARPDVVIYLHSDTQVERRLLDVLGVNEHLADRIGLGIEDVAKAVLG